MIRIGTLMLVMPLAQAPQQDTRYPMTFFVTSVGPGQGGNLGGLAGADSHCQKLATAVGAGDKTWHAYLSTSAADGKPAVNARDRIGKGPWHNAKGVLIARDVAHLHGDTLELARLGNLITKNNALNENSEFVKGVGDGPHTVDETGRPRDSRVHDMMTGSQPDGRGYNDAADHTCRNWTSAKEGSAQVGHHDRNGGGISWNSAHPSRGCSQLDLVSSGGAGLYYCFAVTRE